VSFIRLAARASSETSLLIEGDSGVFTETSLDAFIASDLRREIPGAYR
jgi:hypothetical protein